eukprot:tig00020909_g15350.t1
MRVLSLIALVAVLAIAHGQASVVPPGQMAAPALVELGETHVSFSWSLPSVLGSHAIVYFTVEQSDGDAQLFRQIAQPGVMTRNATVSKLTSGFFYEFRISASMDVPGRGIVSGPVSDALRIKTIPSVPATPIVREAATVPTSSTCTVRWTVAFDGGEPIELFVIERSGVANYTLVETWERIETTQTVVLYKPPGYGVDVAAYNASVPVVSQPYGSRTRFISTGIDLTNYHLRFNPNQITSYSNCTSGPCSWCPPGACSWTPLASLPTPAPASGWPPGARGYQRTVVEERWEARVTGFVYDDAAFRVHTLGLPKSPARHPCFYFPRARSPVQEPRIEIPNEFVPDSSGVFTTATPYLQYTFDRLVHGKIFQVRVSAVNKVGRSRASLPKPLAAIPAAGEKGWESNMTTAGQAAAWTSHNNSCRLTPQALEAGDGTAVAGVGAALVAVCRSMAPELQEAYVVPVLDRSVHPEHFLAEASPCLSRVPPCPDPNCPRADSPVPLGGAVGGIGEVQWEGSSEYLVLQDAAPLDEDPSEARPAPRLPPPAPNFSDSFSSYECRSIAYVRAPEALLAALSLVNESYGGFIDYALHLLKPEGLTGGIEGYTTLGPLPVPPYLYVPARNATPVDCTCSAARGGGSIDGPSVSCADLDGGTVACRCSAVDGSLSVEGPDVHCLSVACTGAGVAVPCSVTHGAPYPVTRVPREMHDVILIAGNEPRSVRKWSAGGFLGGSVALSLSVARDPSIGGPARNSTEYYPPECAGTECEQNFVVHLREDAGWVDWATGAAPSRPRFKEALSRVRDLYIRADYYLLVASERFAPLGRGESYIFDSVMFTRGTAELPEAWHALAPTASVALLRDFAPPLPNGWT